LASEGGGDEKAIVSKGFCGDRLWRILRGGKGGLWAKGARLAVRSVSQCDACQVAV
jgi:hypothetical protein